MSRDISIVIPYYNRPEALRRALASIAQQTVKPKEVIAVDDGSEDEIKDMGIVGNLRIIRQENAGAPAARNRGLKVATGEYVIFWDADVIGEPDMLEKLHDALVTHPDVSFVYSNFYFGRKKMPAQAFDVDALRKCNYISSTTLVRKSDAPKWDESLKRFQDWDYWLTLVEQKKRGVWVDAYLYRAITGGTMSSWLPSCAYKKPWRFLPWWKKRVNEYEVAKQIVQKKHGIT